MVKGSEGLGRLAQQTLTIVIGIHFARNPVSTVAAEIEAVKPVGDGPAPIVTLIYLPSPGSVVIVAVHEAEPTDALRSVDTAGAVAGTAGVNCGGGCKYSGGRERQCGEEELGELHFCPWSVRLALVRVGNKKFKAQGEFEAQGRESLLLQMPICGWRRPVNPRAGLFFFLCGKYIHLASASQGCGCGSVRRRKRKYLH